MRVRYRARDAAGKLVQGFIEADNEQAAGRLLRSRGLFITELRPVEDQPDYLRSLLWKRVGRRDLALFCRQLGTMLAAGLPIVNALRTLSRQEGNPRFKASIDRVVEDLEQGNPLHAALGKSPQVFPPVMVYSVEAGEVSGALDEILMRLAEHFEREHEVQEKIKSAMTYPLIVLVVSLLSIGFIITFVLPMFSNIIANMGVPLPWPTRAVLGLGRFFREWWPWMAAALAAAGYGAWRWSQQERVRYALDKIVLRFPVFGHLKHQALLSQFSRTLGTMLSSGVPILQALEVVERTVGNRILAEAIALAQEQVRDGRSIASPLAESGVFPPMVVEMVTVGEETGTLDALLARLGAFYDREVGEMAARLSSLIEPLLILVLGGVVGVIVVSVLLPVFQVVGSVR
ncbi:MAG: type II secretion system F family protein [Thermoanaerobacteraceae bacterium]|uniref:type II secretion system F family protein n=1 Tax=Thermanaeromonas sp. C210 TaxID=2731925 RepID=UPI00155D14ED|nr:type II secretion system F family protein [Thermanaeromonas sp. C210]MBE3581373.1 type II secretion system F family protein [Thermoanaerobacteraceae bacterium]GFN23291.1 secretion system protein [Thermanaeromonas sp. C210]